ncbi:hypothetical protein ABGB12_21610 [Actinocorallia sp. B10E7]|uniref:hypothetical protein n=1 Tax=Actinocorallia sp. B10E7 TaxID=3153558 RepID=UPI00325E0D78
MFSRAMPGAVFLEPQGSPSWREPAFGLALLLMFALFGLHRLLARGVSGLLGDGRDARPPAVGGGGPHSALSRVRGLECPVGLTGLGAEGFLRALLVEIVTRGGGRVVLGRPELHRLLGGRAESLIPVLPTSRLVVHEVLEETVVYLERCLSTGSADGEEHLYWLLLPDRAPEPLPEHERLHVLLLGHWRHTREIGPGGSLDGETAPTLTVPEAVERLHLFGLTL